MGIDFSRQARLRRRVSRARGLLSDAARDERARHQTAMSPTTSQEALMAISLTRNHDNDVTRGPARSRSRNARASDDGVWIASLFLSLVAVLMPIWFLGTALAFVGDSASAASVGAVVSDAAQIVLISIGSRRCVRCASLGCLPLRLGLVVIIIDKRCITARSRQARSRCCLCNGLFLWRVRSRAISSPTSARLRQRCSWPSSPSRFLRLPSATTEPRSVRSADSRGCSRAFR